MRAVAVPERGEEEVMEVADRSTPEPGPDEVRIDVRAAGVNFADVEQRRGTYRGGPEPPFVPGLEASGVVDAVGDRVDAWSKGDEVVCLLESGGYAERAVARADWTFPVPDDLDLATAGGVLVQAFTAHNALFLAGDLEADDAVLVHAAAGGVGSMAVQFAAVTGATVVATASTERKLSFAADCGADHLVNYEERDVASAVEAATDGTGVDLVLDGVGGDAFASGLDALAAGGTLVSYGVASGRVPTVATPRLLYHNRSVVGYHLLNGLRELPEEVLGATEHLFDLLARADVEATVTERAPLSEAAAVHAALANRDTRGRTVLVPE